MHLPNETPAGFKNKKKEEEETNKNVNGGRGQDGSEISHVFTFLYHLDC